MTVRLALEQPSVSTFQMMNKLIKILLVDDHQIVLDGLQLIIGQAENMELCGIAHNGEEALKQINISAPDVILMDINMPVMNGIEAMKILGKDFPQIAVIGLSMIEDSHIIQTFIEYGAKGFLLKNSGKEKILSAIISVSLGGIFYDEVLLPKILQNKSSKNNRNTLFPKLSRREKEIVKLIINEKTTQEIANLLFISFGTVETHRRNIINKLGVRNTAGLVRVVIEYGLINDVN